MNIQRNTWWLMAVFYLIVGGWLMAPTIQAAPSLTPEQRELLNQLSPEQQDTALQSLQSKGGTPSSPTIVIPKTVAPPSPSPIEKQIEAPQRNPLAFEQQIQAAPEPLKQFGYDLFAGTPTTFAPATDIPVPTDYIIGPGDTIQIQLFGKDNVSYTLIVSRDGELNFPSIGPIAVAGMKFSELRENLMERVANQMIGNKINVTMGQLRSIRVLILGEAQHPGSYTISALSTLTNALLVSGGVKPIGSLRDIQLKRNGQIIVTLDLYDLLLKGDTRGDVRLAPGDVLFIPTIKTTVGIAGAVHRPAIYELKSEKTVVDMLKLAGGPLPIAYLQTSQLERISETGDRTVINLDLRAPAMLATTIKNGDVIRIYSILDRFQDTVTLQGHVHRPGQVQWHQGMRLTDLIHTEKDLLPRPDTSYLVVRRELPDRSIEVLTADLSKALANPKSASNIKLTPKDEIRVFNLDENRVAILFPLITQLRQQTRVDRVEPIVTIHGQVRHPGIYPFIRNMRLADLVKAAVGTLPEVDLDFAVIRREIDNGQRSEVLSTRLRDAIAIPGGNADLPLASRDQIHIFGRNEDRQTSLEPLLTELRLQALTNEKALVVSVAGSVLKPGNYPLTHGMRVSDLIRAGGNLSEAAYTLNAELSRIEVINGNSRETEHLTLDLAAILTGNSAADVPLKPYDRLTIRVIPQWSKQEFVEIKGEVNFPGTYVIRHGEKLSSVLHRAGDLTTDAFPRGAVFIREALQKQVQERIDDLVNRMEINLASTQLSTNQGKSRTEESSTQAMSIGHQLIQQLRATKPIGRLVIDLPELLSGPKIAVLGENRYSELDIILKNGDNLVIPGNIQEVSIMGEVYYPTSHIFQEGLDIEDYINKSGGFTQNANKAQIYVIQANGNVVAKTGGVLFGWLNVLGSQNIQAGDTIVVPLDLQKMQPLTFWGEITKIMYEIALSAAAMKTVGAF